jgi:hypothetical protein
MSETRGRSSPRFDHVYAIVRVDGFYSGLDVPPDHCITVKKIVLDADTAEAEVKRLNVLNAGKNCHYFFQLTRVEKGAFSPPSKDQEP